MKMNMIVMAAKIHLPLMSVVPKLGRDVGEKGQEYVHHYLLHRLMLNARIMIWKQPEIPEEFLLGSYGTQKCLLGVGVVREVTQDMVA